jgi:predicted molibdopterin-dependent oxidoreductase YjgC
VSRRVTLRVDGRPVAAREGQSVAAALLAAGVASFGGRSGAGAPLAPWCLMGVCFGCLCRIDGRRGAQACLEPVRDGLEVELEDRW